MTAFNRQRVIKMRRRILTAVLILGCAGPIAAQGDTEKAMKDIADRTANAIVAVQVNLEEESGARTTSGIGVCVDAKGVFMTMVIDERTDLSAIRSIELLGPGMSSKGVKAELMGVDAGTNLAFVKTTEPGNWSAVQFAPTAEVSVGQRVVSAGLLITRGGRVLNVGVAYVSCVIRAPEKLISVTGGKLTSIGSPVFAADGRAVGMVLRQRFMDYRMITGNRTIQAPLESRQETAFFTAADEFAYVLQKIPTDGRVRRVPWLGVGTFEVVQEEYAAILGLDRPGVMVDQVIPGQPADKAGLRDRDIILEVNGKAIEGGSPDLIVPWLARTIVRLDIGETVALTILRGTQTSTIKVTLSGRPKLPSEAKRYYAPQLGMLVREKVPLDQYIDKSSAADQPGLFVARVLANSPAMAAGLEKKDLIMEVNGQKVTTVASFRQIIENALVGNPSAPIRMTLRRGSQTLEVNVKPQAQAQSQ